MESSKNKIINIFDFDGTLTTETWPKFWVWVKKFGYNGTQRNNKLEKALAEYRKLNTGNDLETFFGFFNNLLANSNEKLTYEELMEGERFIQYNPGVVEFIKNTNTKNYIVSGGIKEFLQNLNIAEYFEGIYGTSMQFDEEGLITGIGEVMTDYKKILAIQDILKRNNRKENDCYNVNYVGDGSTDAEAMKFIHMHGGKAIFVHQPDKNDKLYQYNNNIYQILNADGMIDFCCVADYSNDSVLLKILKGEKEQH